MAAIFPGGVATDANLYVAVNALATTLSGTITNSVATIPLTSTTGFPTAGGVTIDQEVIFYTGVSGGNLTGCTRGADGTTAAAHTSGVPVSHTIIAFHHNGLMAEIEALETYLNSNAFLPSGGGTMTGALVLPAGLVGTPSLTFVGDLNTGIYHGGADTVNISVGGTSMLVVQSNGVVCAANPLYFSNGTVTAPALTFNSDSNTGFYHGPSTGDTYLAANGNLIMRFRDGEVSVHLSTVGGAYEQSFYFQDGVFAPLGTTRNLGTATTYWNNIYYKTLVKEGGFGYFDAGVELQDGSIVSDLEALARLKEDPKGRKTPYGTTWIDPATLPKLVYIPPPEDSIDDVHGEDVHAMMSIMIGALKEANDRIKKLEDKLKE